MLLSTLRRIGPAHGYAVIEDLRRRSDGVFDLPEGTVYPAMHRLERDGRLASEWDTVSGRRRRVYRLTPAGVAALDAKRQQWTAFSFAMRSVAAVERA